MPGLVPHLISIDVQRAAGIADGLGQSCRPWTRSSVARPLNGIVFRRCFTCTNVSLIQCLDDVSRNECPAVENDAVDLHHQRPR